MLAIEEWEACARAPQRYPDGPLCAIRKSVQADPAKSALDLFGKCSLLRAQSRGINGISPPRTLWIIVMVQTF